MRSGYMSRAEAIGLLCGLARRPGLAEPEIVALMMGARAIMKRHFDYARNRARKYSAGFAPEAHPDSAGPQGFSAEDAALMQGDRP